MEDSIERKEIVTVSGLNGSGKSSTAKDLAKVLGYRHRSSGDYARELSLQEKPPYDSVGKFLKDKRDAGIDIDKVIDDWVRKELTQPKVVMDSRLACFWAPDSFRVFLTLDPHTAGKRTLFDTNALRRQTDKAVSFDDAVRKIIARQEGDIEAYKKLYGIDYTDFKYYNLTIDTGSSYYDGKREEVVKLIHLAYKGWLQGEPV